MSFTPPPTRAEAVLNQLRAEIIAGTLVPGQLLKDAELAARLGVSITPIREAISQLAQEGLVEVSPNRWRRVAEMTLEEAVCTLDLQFILFAGALERAVPHLSDADVDSMRHSLAVMHQSIEDGQSAAAAKAVAGFFETGVAKANNRDLKAVWDLVFGRGRRYMGLSDTSNLWPVWLRGFTAVFAAIEAGAGDAACRKVNEMAAEVRQTTLGPDASGYILGAPSLNPKSGR